MRAISALKEYMASKPALKHNLAELEDSNLEKKKKITTSTGNVKWSLVQCEHDFVPHYLQSLYLPRVELVSCCRKCGKINYYD